MTQQSMVGKSSPGRLRAGDGYDWGLLTVVAALLAIGVVMVFSASYAHALLIFETPRPFYFLTQQLLSISVGVVAMVIAMRIPYNFWQHWSIPIMAGTLLLLVLVLLIGDELYGSQRTFADGRIQPSEPAKIAIIIYVAAWLASKGTRIRSVQVGLLPFAILLGLITVLVVAQPNISTAVLIVTTACIMFFIAGADWRQLAIIGLVGGATFWLVIQNYAYAGGRVERFVASFSDPLASPEWQTQRTLGAIVNGGILGKGLGAGEYKMPGSMPLAWSDNILAVIGEEMGMIGTLLIVFLFAMLVYRGLRTALRAPDTFGMLLAVGITALLALQTLLHIAVVVAISPSTGVTLPLISYGGSSMVTALGAVGILLSISRGSRAPSGGESHSIYARLNLGWGDRGARVPRAGGSATSAPSATTGGRSRSQRRA